MLSVPQAHSGRLWGSSGQRGRARCTCQSANMQKTTSKNLSFVTQHPSTIMFTKTSSTTGNHGEINGINVIPSENASNANINCSTQGTIVGVNGVNVTPPTNTTTQSNGCPTPGTNGIDLPVTPLKNTKRDNYAADVTNCPIHSSSPSDLTDSKVSSWWINFSLLSVSFRVNE